MTILYLRIATSSAAAGPSGCWNVRADVKKGFSITAIAYIHRYLLIKTHIKFEVISAPMSSLHSPKQSSNQNSGELQYQHWYLRKDVKESPGLRPWFCLFHPPAPIHHLLLSVTTQTVLEISSPVIPALGRECLLQPWKIHNGSKGQPNPEGCGCGWRHSGIVWEFEPTFLTFRFQSRAYLKSSSLQEALGCCSHVRPLCSGLNPFSLEPAAYKI